MALSSKILLCFAAAMLSTLIVRFALRSKRDLWFKRTQSSIINQRDIAPELAGRLDGINISLNASDSARYQKLCRPIYPDMAFDSMLFFARACKAQGLNCWFSVVDCIGEEEIAACRAVAERVGIPLRVRPTIR